MASNTNTTNTNAHSPTYGSDPASSNTTFVQADPSTFRAVVQKLTGASDDPSAQKLPLTLPSRLTPKPTEMGPRKPGFKLHERRQSSKKLELKLHNTNPNNNSTSLNNEVNFCSSSFCGPYGGTGRYSRGFGGEVVLVSPVSPLEMAMARGSPRTPREVEEEEERAIAEKGFYLHPSPLSTPRGTEIKPPELLPLFPLCSPRDIVNNDSSSSS